MKRVINHMKRLFIKDIKKVPVGVGTELIVQVENVYEEVKTHKKVKKHHGKNKGPK
jgi:ABC-type molybdate transport system substrate-binding protein